jgi:hypothetical protein
MLSERITPEEFEEMSVNLLRGLVSAMPSYFARREAELVRQGEVDLDWLVDVQQLAELELATLLCRPAEAQREPPVGLLRRLVLDSLSSHGCSPSMPELQRRGLLPASAVDIDTDLGPLHLAWGIAKARRMRARLDEATG